MLTPHAHRREVGIRSAELVSFLLYTLFAVVTLSFLITLFRHLFIRAVYPLDIEWMEGAMLLHGERLLSGQELYASPSADHIPFAYTPLYTLLLAALGAFSGITYTLGRALSIGALLALFPLVALALFASTKETARRPTTPYTTLALSLITVGIFCADYLFTGAWFDIVRNDTLFLLFTAGACLLLVERGHTTWGAVLTGLLLALAFWTKQTAIFFVFAAGFYQLLTAPKKLPQLVLSTALFVLLPLLLLNHLTQGRLWFYIRQIHRNHSFNWTLLWPKTPALLFRRHLLLWMGGFLGVVWSLVRHRCVPRRTLFWLGMALTALLASSVSSATAWAHTNARLPASLFTPLFAVVALLELGEPLWRSWRTLLPPLLITALFAVHFTTRRPQKRQLQKITPDANAFARATRFIALLKRLPQPILTPYHPHHGTLSGGKGHFHLHALNDLLAAGSPYPPSIVDGIKEGRWKTILYDRKGRRFWKQIPGLRRYYSLVRDLRRTAPRTYSGNPCAPRYIWIRKELSSSF